MAAPAGPSALSFPSSVPIRALEARGGGYDPERCEDLWRLYCGGDEFDPRRFLLQRQHEPQGIYEERVKRAFYLGYIGEIVDDFVANLFMADPQLELPENADAFWQGFQGDCDRRGSDLAAFFRDRLTRALVQECAFTRIEMPRGTAATIAEADQLGERSAYLIPVNRSDVLDCLYDGDGNLEWATIRSISKDRPSPFSTNRVIVYRWTTLTKSAIATYIARREQRWQESDGETGWQWATGGFLQGEATLEAEPAAHGFDGVPLVPLEVPEALCIGEKLCGPQRHMIELDNAIAWQQFMSLFAMPVVKSEKEFRQLIGEAYFVKLDPGDSFEWTEPQGHALKTSMERREQVKAEMFRIAHQMAAAVSASAATAGRSAESKRRDRTPTEIVLSALAELTRDHVLTCMKLIAKARNEPQLEGQIGIAGMDEFDVEDVSSFIDNELKAQALDVPSPTFKKVRAKRIVEKLEPDLSEDQSEAIEREIDAAEIVLPTPEEKLDIRET